MNTKGVRVARQREARKYEVSPMLRELASTNPSKNLRSLPHCSGLLRTRQDFALPQYLLRYACFGMVRLIPKSWASAGSLNQNRPTARLQSSDNPQKMLFALAQTQQCPPDSNTFAQISQEMQAPSPLYLFLQGASQI